MAHDLIQGRSQWCAPGRRRARSMRPNKGLQLTVHAGSLRSPACPAAASPGRWADTREAGYVQVSEVTMRCWFCLQSTPPRGFSVEHIFPQALGGTLTTKTVCKPCNDRLGHSVDSTLVSHMLASLKRVKLGLPGKGGDVPDPMRRLTFRDSTNGGQLYRLDSSLPRPQTFYALPHVEKQDLGDGTRRVSARVDATDADKIGTILNRALTREGGSPMSAEEIQQLLRSGGVAQEVTATASLSLDLTEYRRGLLKIVYELACLWLGETYLDDPIARAIRECVFDTNAASRHSIAGEISMWGQEEKIMPFWLDEPHALIGAALRHNHDLAVYVRVLEDFEAMVRVTDQATAYPMFVEQFVAVDAVTGSLRRSTYDEEVVRICSRGEG